MSNRVVGFEHFVLNRAQIVDNRQAYKAVSCLGWQKIGCFRFEVEFDRGIQGEVRHYFVHHLKNLVC